MGMREMPDPRLACACSILLPQTPAHKLMRRNFILTVGLFSFLWTAALCQPGPAAGRAAPAGAASGNMQYSAQGRPTGQSIEPVSYASVSQLNGMLAQLEATSKDTQADLEKLRIDRWRTDSGSKKESLTNVESVQRNLQEALPSIIAELRAAPEDVPATFKLYRNLDALYDVLGSVVEATGAFGSKDDLQSLSNDLNSFEGTRKQMAERIENLSTMKEAEIVRLRADLKTAQAAVPAAPPKKVIVDDTEPAKKPPVKRKPAAKPKSAPAKTPAKPAAGQQQTPPAQQQNPQ
jgi:CHASE3 domain sensor protein